VSARIIEVEHDLVAGDAHRLACQRFVSQLAPLARDLSPVVPAAMLAHHGKQLVFLPSEVR